MTICIGALCTSEAPGDTVVLASDRMVTWIGTQFEHPVPKIHSVCPTAQVLIAGDALAGEDVVRRAHVQLAGAPVPVKDAAEAVANSYGDERMGRAEAQVLKPRGLTLAQFYQMHQQLVPQITGGLDTALAAFDLGVELIVAGVDGAGGHLHTVMNPGGIQICHDLIGYIAVGSGGTHALQSMIGLHHSPSQSLTQAVFQVLTSKQRAEVAPGVGRETDLIVIGRDGPRSLAPGSLERLDELCARTARDADAAVQRQAAQLQLEFEAISGETGSAGEVVQGDGSP